MTVVLVWRQDYTCAAGVVAGRVRCETSPETRPSRPVWVAALIGIGATHDVVVADDIDIAAAAAAADVEVEVEVVGIARKHGCRRQWLAAGILGQDTALCPSMMGEPTEARQPQPERWGRASAATAPSSPRSRRRSASSWTPGASGPGGRGGRGRR